MLIAKYKFDSSLYDLIPEFNSGYEGYTYTDEVDGNIVTRTIECDTLPTMMRFGTDGSATDKSKSLIEILDMNTSELTHMNVMFRQCTNLTKITCEWDTSKVINFNSMFTACVKLEKVDVSDWDVGQATSFSWMFEGVKWDTIDVSNWDVSNVTATNGMFYGCHNILNLDVSNWITNKVTVMNYMFHGCNGITTLDVGNWDTSQVTSMSYMFYQCRNLTSLDLSKWDTSKVTNMQEMFYECNNLSEIIQTNLVTSALTSMNRMFYGCNSLIEINTTNWNTSNVNDMCRMFQACYQLMTLDTSNWNTSNVTNMSLMFLSCINLTTLDTSNWNTSKVTDMQQMFRGCKQLIGLDVSNWDMSKVTDMYAMFNSCSSLTSLDVSNWNTSSLVSAPELFYNCSKLTSLDLGKWNTSNVVGMGYMFGSCSSLITLDVSNWNIDKVTNFSDILAGSNSLKYVKCNNFSLVNELSKHLPIKTSTQGTIVCKQRDLSELDMAILNSKNWTVVNEPILIAKYVFDKSIYNNTIPEFNTDFEGYFIEDVEVEGNEVTRVIESCGMLHKKMIFGSSNGTQHRERRNSLLKMLFLNTSNMTTFAEIFAQCINLNYVDTSNWDTSKVNNMSTTFYYCYNLESLDVSNWNTSNVTTFWHMFTNCSKLLNLDVKNWNIDKAPHMANMFSGSGLTKLDISNWVMNGKNIQSIFNNCSKLTLLDISSLDMSNTTNVTELFITTPRLIDIGMLNCNKQTIQKVVDLLPNVANRTIWYKEANVEGITLPSHVRLREYKEESVEIVLNSPLLEGDTIEMVDGNLCHVHRYEKVVLDGNDDEGWWSNGFNGSNIYLYCSGDIFNSDEISYRNIYCDRLRPTIGNIVSQDAITSYNQIHAHKASAYARYLYVPYEDTNVSNFKQWLSDNPTTIVYELLKPTYENITPLQSELTLKTLEECSMEIITNLPIKTNITYRTNITSVYELERQVNSVDTSGVSLANLIEEEVDE